MKFIIKNAVEDKKLYRMRGEILHEENEEI